MTGLAVQGKETKVVFYNGANLLIDLVIAALVGFITYRAAFRSGFALGYGTGQYDTRNTVLSILTEAEELPADFWEPVRKNHEEYL